MEVENLGTDVPPERFVEAARRGVDVVGMSSLLTTTRQVMAEVVEMLVSEGLRAGVKVVIGGAAVTEKFATDIGADAYGSDANEAVRLTRAMLGLS